jgi:PAS domain S-box-containing protein
MRTSLRGKLIAVALLIQFATLALLTWNGQQLIEERLLRQFDNRLTLMTPLLSAALITPMIQRDYATATETLQAMQAHEDFSYLVLLDHDGRRIAANRWPAERALPPAMPALSGESARRIQRYDGRVTIAYAGLTYGELAFGIDLGFLHRAREEHLVQTLTIAFAGLLSSALLLLLASLWLTRHLRRLTRASEALATGQPYEPLAIATRDEIGMLARSFESMASALQARMDELRAAEQAAARQGQRYRNLLGTASDGLHVMSLDGRLVEASDSFYRMLGQPLGTPLAVWDWDAQWTREELIEHLPRQGEDIRIFETRHRRADGKLVDVEVSTRAIAIDGQRLIYASARDISTRKAAENLLRAYAAEQQAMLNNGIVGIVRLRERRVVWVNDAFAEGMGYTPAELDGQSSRLIYPDDASYAAMDASYEVLRKGGIWRGQGQFVRKDGELRWYDISGGLLPDGDSLWSVVDITDLKRALQAAEEASNAKSRFLATLSHELRNPLNGVLGMVQLLLATELGEEQRNYVTQVQASTEDLLHVINNLLAIAKLQNGQRELACADFDLPAALGANLDAWAAQAQAKGLAFEQRIDPALPRRVHGDAARLAEVLDHLVGNALKFTAAGSVTVSFFPVAHTADRITLRCEISDSGIGIPADQLAELFVPFNQLDASMTRRFGGTGLGLAIAKQLVESLGGEIGVDSRPGAGSTFWFTIACAPASNGASAAPSFDPAAMLSRLGGDQEMVRMIIDSLLADMPERMTSLAAALAERDAATARREAHTLKGLAETGGCGALRQCALDIQLLCEAGKLADAAERQPQCASLLAAALDAWRAYLAAPQGARASNTLPAVADGEAATDASSREFRDN